MITRCFHSCIVLNAKDRIPLIKFLGKRTNIKIIDTLKQTPVVSSTSLSSTTLSKPIPTPMSIKGTSIPGSGVDFRSLAGGAMYGRPAISIQEMLEIDSGGASAF